MRKEWFLSFLFLAACNESVINKEKPIKIGNVLLVLPDSTKIIEKKGIDSYNSFFVLGSRDTFNIEYGLHGIIYSLYVSSPHVFPLSDKEKLTQLNGKAPTDEEALFSEYPVEDEGQKIFDKNYYVYDTINSIVVKIIQPKRIGNGMTGLYVPKLKNGYSLSIYAKNLDSATHTKALNIFKTLRYK